MALLAALSGAPTRAETVAREPDMPCNVACRWWMAIGREDAPATAAARDEPLFGSLPAAPPSARHDPKRIDRPKAASADHRPPRFGVPLPPEAGERPMWGLPIPGSDAVLGAGLAAYRP